MHESIKWTNKQLEKTLKEAQQFSKDSYDYYAAMRDYHNLWMETVPAFDNDNEELIAEFEKHDIAFEKFSELYGGGQCPHTKEKCPLDALKLMCDGIPVNENCQKCFAY